MNVSPWVEGVGEEKRAILRGKGSPVWLPFSVLGNLSLLFSIERVKRRGTFQNLVGLGGGFRKGKGVVVVKRVRPLLS